LRAPGVPPAGVPDRPARERDDPGGRGRLRDSKGMGPWLAQRVATPGSSGAVQERNFRRRIEPGPGPAPGGGVRSIHASTRMVWKQIPQLASKKTVRTFFRSFIPSPVGCNLAYLA